MNKFSTIINKFLKFAQSADGIIQALTEQLSMFKEQAYRSILTNGISLLENPSANIDALVSFKNKLNTIEDEINDNWELEEEVSRPDFEDVVDKVEELVNGLVRSRAKTNKGPASPKDIARLERELAKKEAPIVDKKPSVERIYDPSELGASPEGIEADMLSEIKEKMNLMEGWGDGAKYQGATQEGFSTGGGAKELKSLLDIMKSNMARDLTKQLRSNPDLKDMLLELIDIKFKKDLTDVDEGMARKFELEDLISNHPSMERISNKDKRVDELMKLLKGQESARESAKKRMEDPAVKKKYNEAVSRSVKRLQERAGIVLNNVKEIIRDTIGSDNKDRAENVIKHLHDTGSFNKIVNSVLIDAINQFRETRTVNSVVEDLRPLLGGMSPDEIENSDEVYLVKKIHQLKNYKEIGEKFLMKYITQYLETKDKDVERKKEIIDIKPDDDATELLKFKTNNMFAQYTRNLQDYILNEATSDDPTPVMNKDKGYFENFFKNVDTTQRAKGQELLNSIAQKLIADHFHKNDELKQLALEYQRVRETDKKRAKEIKEKVKKLAVVQGAIKLLEGSKAETMGNLNDLYITHRRSGRTGKKAELIGFLLNKYSDKK